MWLTDGFLVTFLSFEWNLIRLSGPAHRIVTKLYTKLCQGVVGVKGVGVGGWGWFGSRGGGV